MTIIDIYNYAYDNSFKTKHRRERERELMWLCKGAVTIHKQDQPEEVQLMLLRCVKHTRPHI